MSEKMDIISDQAIIDTLNALYPEDAHLPAPGWLLDEIRQIMIDAGLPVEDAVYVVVETK